MQVSVSVDEAEIDTLVELGELGEADARDRCAVAELVADVFGTWIRKRRRKAERLAIELRSPTPANRLHEEVLISGCRQSGARKSGSTPPDLPETRQAHQRAGKPPQD